MKDEVEDFLRRVAQMRAQAEAQAKGQQQRPTPPTPPKQRETPKPARQPTPRLTPQRPPTLQPQLEPVEAEIVQPELRQRDAVSRHVQQHLRGNEEIAEHTRNLGAEVDLADEKLEAHLHQVFDHQLGQLKTSGDGAAGPQAQGTHDLSAVDILRLLRSPQSVRDAFIMSEIFRRPDTNW
jgi:hypothetical protein